MNKIKHIVLGGVKTAIISRTQLAECMVKDCVAYRTHGGRPKLVFSSNGQGISLAGTDSRFLSVMDSADIVHADGQSVVIMSRLLAKSPLPERVATTDFFHDAAKAAAREGLSFYILGGAPDENQQAVDNIRRMYPSLVLAGHRHGYFTEDEEPEVIDHINSARPDVLWIGLGKPKQEYWCVNNQHRLNVGWMKTCGGLYGFLSGDSKRAPLWMQRCGFEWLYRLLQNPRRLALRYLITSPHALFLLIVKSRSHAVS